MRIGLDIGSTTIKCVALNEQNEIVFSSYERHNSHIAEKAAALLQTVQQTLGITHASLAISGSAAMGFAEHCGVSFVQEVFATRIAAQAFAPDTDCIIELGGEDAKILFLKNGVEVRMNGSCAGGTGAFIDQMATLLGLTPAELDKQAAKAEKIHTIASRCGVFAKTDVQPLLNQGATIPDISASILHAVVNQTIAGLAQGRAIEGNVLYLGGPLTFFSQLRAAFDQTLHLTGRQPENSLYFVALGTALYADTEAELPSIITAMQQDGALGSYASRPPLFASKEEYEEFHARHIP